MSIPGFHSVRRHFVYDTDRSRVVKSTYFFKYLHRFEIYKDDNLSREENIYLIVEPYEITLKQEVLVYKDTELLSTQFKNLLVVPLNTNHSNFAEIETQLIRLKQADLKEAKHKKKQEEKTFEQVLYDFVEDLYVNQYFLECGDVQKIKSGLEHIPLIQGIIRKFLFDYYYKDCISFRKKDIRISYKRAHFEDAYLNYSSFLSQPQNEKLFIRGGWFVKQSAPDKGNIDYELERIENGYIEVEQRLKETKTLSSKPVNIKLILKRYGIYNILKLTLPSPIPDIFLLNLAGLVFFILADVLLFNQNLGEWHARFFQKGLYISSFLFVFLTAVIAVLLFIRHRIRVVPGIFLPRMVIAIMSGWLLFLTAEELLKIDIDISGQLLTGLVAGIFFVTLSFMVFEINNYAPAMIIQNIIKRSLVVTGLAFVVSYSFGFWVMTHINDKYMSLDNFVVNESRFKKILERREDYFQDVVNDLFEEQKKYAGITDSIRDISQGKIPRGRWKDELRNIDYNSENPRDLQGIEDLDNINTNISRIVSDYNKNADSLKRKLDSRRPGTRNSTYQAGTIVLAGLIDKDTLKNTFTALQDSLDNLKTANDYLFEYLKDKKKIQIGAKYYVPKTYSFEPLSKHQHTTFPNMLLTRALLAMFIGIFLQLIIQDKTITEPI